MNALLGQSLNLLLRKGESEIMDISGHVTDIETRLPADGMMKTHLTIINTENDSDDWDLTRILNPGKVIVRCSYCDSWAAAKTKCKHCGGAV